MKFLIEFIIFSSSEISQEHLMKIKEEFFVNFLIHIIKILLNELISVKLSSILFNKALNWISRLSSLIFINIYLLFSNCKNIIYDKKYKYI